MSRKPLVIGIDGSAAKSTGMIADEQGTVLAQSQGGAIGSTAAPDSFARSVFQLTSRLCEEAHSSIVEIGAITIGLGSALRESDRLRSLEALQLQLRPAGTGQPAIMLETDARIALEGAFGGQAGVVLIAGRGTVVLGKTDRGEIVTAGGWGRILGDEGSGYFIGREALVAVAQDADRLVKAGTLREVFGQKFQLDTRERIINAVYQEKLDLASLAPAVLETASHNDVIAQRIIYRAATLLAEQVRVVVMRMGVLRKVGLVLTGSFVEQEKVYANVLQMKIMKMLPQVEFRKAMYPPVRGAVLLAQQLLTR